MGMNVTNVPLHSEAVHTSPVQTRDFSSQPWHAAYMAALFETDRKQMADRITHARRLIFLREQDFLVSPADRAEQNALDRATYALRALRTCLGL